MNILSKIERLNKSGGDKMIPAIIVITLGFIWLGYETDWMRVRLLVGVIEQPKQGLWQFLKYGGDCIMLRDRCYIRHCKLCRQGDRFFAWRIPARTVKVFGSTINFKAGCNLYRAKLLRDIIKALLSPYTTKARVGRKTFIIPVGEADRVV